MNVVRELARVAMWTMAFTVLGGVIGALTAAVCEEVGLVRYSWYGDSLNAGFRSLFLGAGMGGLLGFGWSVRQWYKRLHPIPELEDELW